VKGTTEKDEERGGGKKWWRGTEERRRPVKGGDKIYTVKPGIILEENPEVLLSNGGAI